MGQDFLEQLDNWLSEKEQEEEIRIEKGLLDPELNRKSKTAKVGVGVFLFEHHDKKERTPGDGDQPSDAMESTG